MELIGRSGWEQLEVDEAERESAMQFKVKLLMAHMLEDTVQRDLLHRRLESRIQRIERFR